MAEYLLTGDPQHHGPNPPVMIHADAAGYVLCNLERLNGELVRGRGGVLVFATEGEAEAIAATYPIRLALASADVVRDGQQQVRGLTRVAHVRSLPPTRPVPIESGASGNIGS